MYKLLITNKKINWRILIKILLRIVWKGWERKIKFMAIPRLYFREFNAWNCITIGN